MTSFDTLVVSCVSSVFCLVTRHWLLDPDNRACAHLYPPSTFYPLSAYHSIPVQPITLFLFITFYPVYLFILGLFRLFGLLSFSFFVHITAYTSPTCLFLLRGQPIIITFLYPYLFCISGISFGL
ncbi:hypothetical protein EDD85DRAFT_509468 [Armillaria nabsnona]|nr:hypothetical protein EDD85DRAFT_509468 [Armillaria nabsnona]